MTQKGSDLALHILYIGNGILAYIQDIEVVGSDTLLMSHPQF
jgi:hypothetical protein